MSFGRAKRFYYRDPDVKVSPADYNLSSHLHKGTSLSKCPRFLEKQKRAEEFVCSKAHCTKEIHGPHCMTPNIKKGQSFSNKSNVRSDSAFSRSSSSRASSRKLSFKNSTPKTKSDAEAEAEQKDPVNSPIPRITFSSSPDDDYFSTSSEEWESIRNQTEEYKLVCKTLLELERNNMLKERGGFEKTVLEKMDEIQQSIAKLQKDFSSLSNNINSDKSIEHSNQVSERRFDAEKMITKAIDELQRELENKRRNMFKHNELKIKKLMDEIQSANKNCSAEIKELCDKVFSDIARKLATVLNGNRYEGSQQITDGNSYSHSEHECFNYENICKVLSNHLQLTHDEKDCLEQKNLEITMKYGQSQQALETQASLIRLLQNELKSLRTYIKRLDV